MKNIGRIMNVVAGKQWQAYVSYSTILLLHSTDQESLWLCCSASAQITQPHAGNSYLATSSISDCCAPTLVQYQKSQEGRRKIHFNMQPPTTPKIPVDRDWIEKLLRKHAKAVPSRRGTSSECDEKCGDDIKPIKMKALVVAPMVDQSDLPFRLLCRRYGANLAVTPMIHARLLVTSETYRKKFIGNFVPEDRPLIAQICGSDPDIVLEAARYLEPHVDGIDLNCGCPQGIAKRGNYGAYLLEQEETLLKLVRHLVKHLNVPLSVKVRLLPHDDPPSKDNDKSLPMGEEKRDSEGNNIIQSSHQQFLEKKRVEQRNQIVKRSLDLYTKLVDAGIHLLTIHGRTRHNKGPLICESDWDAIRQAVDLLGHRIPIFANGSIQNGDDIIECLKVTNADGVMSSEAVLEYPPIFNDDNLQYQESFQDEGPQEEKSDLNTGTLTQLDNSKQRTIGRLQVTQEYMDLARQYPPQIGGQGSGLKCIRMHVHRFLHADLQSNPKIRKLVVDVDTVEGLQQALNEIAAIRSEQSPPHDVSREELSWYVRHRKSDEADCEHLQQQSSSGMPQLSAEDERLMHSVATSLFSNDYDGDY